MNWQLGRITGVALAAGLALSLSASMASAAVIRASDDGELADAIGKARAGDVIELTGPTYSTVTVSKRTFERPVRITSRNPSAPAALRGLRIVDSSGIEVSDVRIGRALDAGEPEWAKVAEVLGSGQIRLSRIHFHGSLDNDPGNDGWGIFVRNSHDVAIEQSTFNEFNRAAVFERVRNVRLVRNVFDRLRSDGSDFAGVQNVLIDGNRYSNFFPQGKDHADAIQFWTTNQNESSTDIVITNNIVLPGEGAGIQGIFMRDERETLPFRRVRIQNNLLYGSDQWHGITINHAEDVEVANNTVLSDPKARKQYWIRFLGVRNGRMHDNVTDRIFVEKSEAVDLAQNTDFAAGGSRRKIPNLGAGRAARPQDLIMPGRGYQPVGSVKVEP